jgi:PhnB protein
MQVQPYLFFNGRCEEALKFYHEALGAEVTSLMRFNEAPDQSGMLPGTGDKIMHADFRIGDTTILTSDGMCSGQLSFEGIALTLNAPDAAEADRLFAALADGGQVQMPMSQTFFAQRFGMVADRFGVSWMVIAAL